MQVGEPQDVFNIRTIQCMAEEIADEDDVTRVCLQRCLRCGSNTFADSEEAEVKL